MNFPFKNLISSYLSVNEHKTKLLKPLDKSCIKPKYKGSDFFLFLWEIFSVSFDVQWFGFLVWVFFSHFRKTGKRKLN